MKSDARLRSAIDRNLKEATLARYEHVARRGLEAAETFHIWDFFKIAEEALFNDMIGHAIKVLDRDRRSSTFWFVWRLLERDLRPVLESTGVTLSELEDLASRLKIIRDQSHFHIDRDAVKDPGAGWERADIATSQFTRALDAVIVVLLEAHRKVLATEFDEMPPYDGTDITYIMKAASAQGLLLK